MDNDKQQANVIIRYLLFYCCLITVLSLTSYILDLFFYRYDYGSATKYHYTPLQYFPYYMIIGYFIFPFSFIYNYLAHKLPPGFNLSKIIFSLLFMLIIGFLMNPRYRFGYYIGEYRVLKNFILMILSGIFLETIRFYVVQNRHKLKAMN